MQKNALVNFVLPALNLLGVLMIVVGVFAFASVLTNRAIDLIVFKLSSDSAFGLIVCGVLLFAAASFASRIIKRN